jgi:hypothetical protein
MEVTTEPSPEISEKPPISREIRARARWGAQTRYGQTVTSPVGPEFMAPPDRLAA